MQNVNPINRISQPVKSLSNYFLYKTIRTNFADTKKSEQLKTKFRRREKPLAARGVLPERTERFPLSKSNIEFKFSTKDSTAAIRSNYSIDEANIRGKNKNRNISKGRAVVKNKMPKKQFPRSKYKSMKEMYHIEKAPTKRGSYRPTQPVQKRFRKKLKTVINKSYSNVMPMARKRNRELSQKQALTRKPKRNIRKSYRVRESLFAIDKGISDDPGKISHHIRQIFQNFLKKEVAG